MNVPTGKSHAHTKREWSFNGITFPKDCRVYIDGYVFNDTQDFAICVSVDAGDILTIPNQFLRVV